MRLTPKGLRCLIQTSQVVRVRIPSSKCCTVVFDDFELLDDGNLILKFPERDADSMVFSVFDILAHTPEVDGGIVKGVASSSPDLVYELTFLSLQQTKIMLSWLESEAELEALYGKPV